MSRPVAAGVLSGADRQSQAIAKSRLNLLAQKGQRRPAHRRGGACFIELGDIIATLSLKAERQK
jgi:hypothetical protein